MNKLASAKASGEGRGSKVLTGLVEGLEEPAFAAELRLKIDQTHADLKGGYATILDVWSSQFFVGVLTNLLVHLGLFGSMGRQLYIIWRISLLQIQSFKKRLLTMKE